MIQVTKKVLAESLSSLERIVQARSSNPILTYLKLETTPNGLRLSGTNLEMDLETTVAAQVSEEAVVVVPAHLFSQIVRSLSSELVELELSGNELNIQGGGFKTKLQTGDLDAYPELSFPSQADTVLDAREFARALSSVRYAAATEAFQAVFRGIKLELSEKRTRVVASDGFRLALREFAGSNVEKNLILPARAVDELTKLLKDGEVQLSFAGSVLGLSTPRWKLNVKLLEGEFPDYERVIPKEVKLSIRLSASALREAVNRVAVLADKTANNRVEFQVSGSSLSLASEGDYGRAQDALEVFQEGTEPALTLGFNAKYVTDALGPLEGEVLIQLSGSNTPALFKAAEDSGYSAVVVPLRV